MYIIDKFTSDTYEYFNKVFLWKRLEEDMQISREKHNAISEGEARAYCTLGLFKIFGAN